MFEWAQIPLPAEKHLLKREFGLLYFILRGESTRVYTCAITY